MYTKRVQIINYGPIDQLDIEFPFDGDVPKPVLLVGENGSGKSILLSQIVNGLISAKGVSYPDTPEVETGKVFKIRSGSYIKNGSEGYFTRVDFEQDLFMGEIRSRFLKQDYQVAPEEFSNGDAQDAWAGMGQESNDHLTSNISTNDASRVRDLLSNNCILYLPHNRFEEPAWLNEASLKSQAEFLMPDHLQGSTIRKVINYSPLKENQNWLFGILYDRAVLETQTVNLQMPIQDDGQSVPLPIQIGPSGDATGIYQIAIQVAQRVVRGDPTARFGIGRRENRVVSLEGTNGNIVPNIFQLSSGETSLLNLFLSILRDFDLTKAHLINTSEIRGIVVVDEIDLHLHTVHQHEVLPDLMHMFPKVQFVVTTHSPLFVLGMAQTFGEDGFSLYRMPQGQKISPEEFSEFGEAYQAFSATSKFSDDLLVAVIAAQTPILYMEGKTDIQYVRRAAELLDNEAVIDGIEIQDGGGSGGLTNIWKALLKLSDSVVLRKIVLLFDCDYPGDPQSNGNRFKRKNQQQNGHPIGKGIENLFSRATLDKALIHEKAFINVEQRRQKVDDGEEITVPEQWDVNPNQKTNLCNWLCENGTAEDFQHFHEIFELLKDALGKPEN